jgi:hypothetical protein
VKNDFVNAIPDESSKLNPLTKGQKANNRRIMSAKIKIDHINSRFKSIQNVV